MKDSFRMDIAPEGVNFAWRDRSLLPLSTKNEQGVRENGTGGPAAHLPLAAWQLSRVTASGVWFGATPSHILSEGLWESPLQFPHFSGAQIWIPEVWGVETIAHVQPHKSTRLLNLRKLLMSICDGRCLLQSEDLLMQRCWGKLNLN